MKWMKSSKQQFTAKVANLTCRTFLCFEPLTLLGFITVSTFIATSVYALDIIPDRTIDLALVPGHEPVVAQAEARPPRLTISGISSGAFMAVQMGTAFSSEIQGVGSVAGGFFYCAQNHLQEKIEEGRKNILVGTNNLFLFLPSGELNHLTPAPGNPIYMAVGQCMQNPAFTALPVLAEFEKQNLIDPISNIKNQKIYIYQGEKDTVVRPKMAQQLESFYKESQVPVESIKMKTLNGGHNFPTDKKDLNDCQNQSVPYISSCKYNLAEDMLQHLLGRSLQRSEPNFKNLYRIDQNIEPINSGLKPEAWVAPRPSLSAYGYMYASEKCLAQPSQCDVHVALHGCEMSDSFNQEFDKRYTDQVAKTRVVGMRTSSQRPWYLKTNVPVIEELEPKMGALQFAMKSGYVELAEKNDIIFIFPQTWITADSYPYNPKGCWDWFGSTGAQYATKQGSETSWLMDYIRQIRQNPAAYILNEMK